MDNKIHILQADKELQNFIVSGVLVQVPAGVRQTDLEDTCSLASESVPAVYFPVSTHNLAEWK